MINNLLHFETGLEFDEPELITINEVSDDNYIDSIIRVNKLPFKNTEMFFTDDIWDFSKHISLNVSKSDLKFNFSYLDDNFKLEAKKFVLVKFLENKIKLSSIMRYSDELHRYFKFLCSKNVFSVKDVTLGVLSSYIETRRDISILSLRTSRGSLKSFYRYYAANYGDILTPDQNTLLEFSDSKGYKAHKNNNKTPDIPSEYFDKLIQTILKIIDDPNEPLKIRATGCVILIMSQTGLRISEILALEVDSLDTITILDDQEANYIRYKTWKREKGNNSFSYERIFINCLAKKGYETLLALHEERRSKIGINYLYTGNVIFHPADHYPIDANAFGKIQRDFFFHIDKYIPTIDVHESSRNNLQTVNIEKSMRKTLKMYNRVGKTLTHPKTQQYRVRVCSDLYSKGVPLKYIKKFMGHLSSEMSGYYVRPRNEHQENLEFSKKTLEDIITGKHNLLGSNSKDLTSRIQKFIEENNLNVETDLQSIVESLTKMIPIRQKFGGVCIKGSLLRDCSLDAKTNEFYCAYGVCQNIFHFFYNVDISYRKAKELSQSIEINIENGFKKQVQKEMNMLNSVLTKQFQPEFAELQSEIRSKGIESIILEYPDLIEIIENIQEIELEVESWKNLATA